MLHKIDSIALWRFLFSQCGYCKYPRFVCTLKIVKANASFYASSGYFSPYIPNWFINMIRLKQCRMSTNCHYRISDWIIQPSIKLMIQECAQNNTTSMLLSNSTHFVAWWISSELQYQSPLFKSTELVTATDQRTYINLNMTTSEIIHQSTKSPNMDEMNRELGWSDNKKSDVYLSTIADLRSQHVESLTGILHKGKRFVGNVTGIDPDNIYCIVHFPVDALTATLHVHFLSKLGWLEWYRLKVSGRSLWMEDVIACLKRDGNVHALLDHCYICGNHRTYQSSVHKEI